MGAGWTKDLLVFPGPASWFTYQRATSAEGSRAQGAYEWLHKSALHILPGVLASIHGPNANRLPGELPSSGHGPFCLNWPMSQHLGLHPCWLGKAQPKAIFRVDKQHPEPGLSPVVETLKQGRVGQGLQEPWRAVLTFPLMDAPFLVFCLCLTPSM